MKVLAAGVMACAAMALSVSLLAQGPRRDGNWEVTMTMDMPGMPQGMSMPPMKSMQCITPADAADPAKTVPQRPAGRGGAANPNDCKVSDYKTDGNKVTWSMKCEGAQPMSGTGEFLYGTDSYTGTMKMDMARGGQPMAVTMKYEGKRLGDCTK
ncbi:MAG TPA: DUF3617 family protein [Vicinamibacterales bacterium]|nr:DUF3617 family protein [Vicinamibacterales bacterium]